MKTMILATVTLVLFAGCFASANALSNTSASAPQEKEKQEKKDPLLNPDGATAKAPDTFRVKFETSAGSFVLECNRKWSPNGADRFYNLVKIGYFKDIAIFRAIDGFMFQFGIHGDPKVSRVWREAKIKDDASAKGVSNKPGYISFATAGPDTRTTQMFINLGDNERLDSMGFTPFGRVVSGMDVVKKVNTEYGENARSDQRRFQAEGNAFIKGKYPNVDFIKSVTLVKQKKGSEKKSDK